MTPKRRLAWLLRNFYFAIERVFLGLAERLDPMPKFHESPLEQGASTETMIVHIKLRREHPCPTCNGKGYVLVSGGSDTAICPTCQGAYIDPDYLYSGKVK